MKERRIHELVVCQVTFGCLFLGFLFGLRFFLFGKKKRKGVGAVNSKEMAFPPFFLKVLI